MRSPSSPAFSYRSCREGHALLIARNQVSIMPRGENFHRALALSSCRKSAGE